MRSRNRQRRARKVGQLQVEASALRQGGQGLHDVQLRLEPPQLFRGRGEHPKQGLLKKRTFPESISAWPTREGSWEETCRK